MQKNILLSCGEDTKELLTPLADIEEFSDYHEYRCYKFWKFSTFTLIWTGFGTSCLEPLLWEILKPNIAERIILFGSSGNLPQSRAELGKAYIITEAYLALTAIDVLAHGEPFRPAYPLPKDCTTASIVSTDLFYGFSPLALTNEYPIDIGTYREKLDRHFDATDMVDMEVAQFYYFCKAFAGNRPLQYVAVKGPSNVLGDTDQQIIRSSDINRSTLQLAMRLLPA